MYDWFVMVQRYEKFKHLEQEPRIDIQTPFAILFVKGLGIVDGDDEVLVDAYAESGADGRVEAIRFVGMDVRIIRYFGVHVGVSNSAGCVLSERNVIVSCYHPPVQKGVYPQIDVLFCHVKADKFPPELCIEKGNI